MKKKILIVTLSFISTSILVGCNSGSTGVVKDNNNISVQSNPGNVSVANGYISEFSIDGTPGEIHETQNPATSSVIYLNFKANKDRNLKALTAKFTAGGQVYLVNGSQLIEQFSGITVNNFDVPYVKFRVYYGGRGEYREYTIFVRTIQQQTIEAKDKDKDYIYAKQSFNLPGSVVPEEYPLIPHRTYIVKYDCSLDAKPCDLKANSASIVGTEIQENLPLRDFSKPLREALINNGLVQNNGDVNLVRNLQYLNGVITFEYTPYYAESNGNNIKFKIGNDIVSVKTPKVGEFYNYAFETALVKNPDNRYVLTTIDHKFNISDEYAGNDFRIHLLSPLDKLINSDDKTKLVENKNYTQYTIDYIKANLRKEGRYGVAEKRFGDYGSDVSVGWRFQGSSAYAIDYVSYYFDPITVTNIPIKVPVQISIAGLYNCYGFVTPASDNGAGPISLTYSQDGSFGGSTYTQNLTCKQYDVKKDVGQDGQSMFRIYETGKLVGFHATSHYDRDYRGEGASIRLFM